MKMRNHIQPLLELQAAHAIFLSTQLPLALHVSSRSREGSDGTRQWQQVRLATDAFLQRFFVSRGAFIILIQSKRNTVLNAAKRHSLNFSWVQQWSKLISFDSIRIFALDLVNGASRLQRAD